MLNALLTMWDPLYVTEVFHIVSDVQLAKCLLQ